MATMDSLFDGSEAHLMCDESTADIVDRLKEYGRGVEEWRVADPESGAYCISFARSDSLNPEREAREWFADHKTRFPGSQFAGYEVRRVMAQSHADEAMNEAAVEIGRLRAKHAALEESCQKQRETAAAMISHRDGVINGLRDRIARAPLVIMDTRDVLGICAPDEEDFPALYALQGKRVRLVTE